MSAPTFTPALARLGRLSQLSNLSRLAAALLLAWALPAVAQHEMNDMGDMGDMDGMAMPAAPAAPAPASAPAAAPSDHSDHSEHADHGDHGDPMAPTSMPAATPALRSPDYSDGLGHGDMPGMDMQGDPLLGMLRIDRLEAFDGRQGNGQLWDLQGWWGRDRDKLVLRSEGERRAGQLEDASVELLWSRIATAYWSTQLGLRHDFGVGPERSWVALGVEGLAPYWFDVQATAYVGPAGRTAARLRASYDLLITQRLILQPEFELNAYGRADPGRGLGSGLSDAALGLRLRYEIRRECAPYIGVSWVQRYGASADAARQEGRSAFDQRIVAGLRVWF